MSHIDDIIATLRSSLRSLTLLTLLKMLKLSDATTSGTAEKYEGRSTYDEKKS